MEDEPVRVLRTWFMTADRKYYELTIETSTLEKEDMAEAIFVSIIILCKPFVLYPAGIAFYVQIQLLTALYVGKVVERIPARKTTGSISKPNQGGRVQNIEPGHSDGNQPEHGNV